MISARYDAEESTVRSSNVAAVILAAGQSIRLGQPKQLVAVSGESLLRRTARVVASSRVATTYVVLGHDSEALSRELAGLNVRITEAPDFRDGLAHSLRHGLRAAQETEAELDAVLFVPCDLPLLSTTYIDALIARYEETGAPIVCSEYDGVQGIPAIFARTIWGELEKLQGDKGARSIIAGCAEREALAFGAGALDVDTPADLERFVPPEPHGADAVEESEKRTAENSENQAAVSRD